MKITARCLAAFTPLLEPAELAIPGGQSCTGFPGPDAPLASLTRFEGALAWESGASRSAVPDWAPEWTRDAWLAGWDHADARFYHADDHLVPCGVP